MAACMSTPAEVSKGLNLAELAAALLPWTPQTRKLSSLKACYHIVFTMLAQEVMHYTTPGATGASHGAQQMSRAQGGALTGQ